MSRPPGAVVLLVSSALVMAAACTVGAPVCEAGPPRCEGGEEVVCSPDGQSERRACEAACVDGFGCRECAPSEVRCDGQNVMQCSEAGTWRLEATCDPLEGTQCAGGICFDACASAARSNSYLGCEYWPTITPNTILPDNGQFEFAVVASNPNEIPARVVIGLVGETPIHDALVDPGVVRTFVLPWVDGLLQRGQQARSASITAGAYRMTSTLPVSAYSYNPLQFGGDDCNPLSADNGCSVTNDATLLLPTSGLTGRYLVVSHPTTTHLWPGNDQANASRSFMAVVGTEDATSVTIDFSAFTEVGPGLVAYEPGDRADFTLLAGQVLLFVARREGAHRSGTDCGTLIGDACQASQEYDLTGSTIDADAPVAVFTGSECANVPYDVEACDHLMDQALPREAWGTRFALVSTEALVEGMPNVFRIVSGADDNRVVFDPPILEPTLLSEAEVLEVTHYGAFEVRGQHALSVTQYMVGASYFGPDRSSAAGDPSMAFAVAVEQFRTSYDVLTAETYTRSWLNIVADLGAPPTVDGFELPVELSPIGASGLGAARLEVTPGPHHLEAEQPFGVQLVGTAFFTSYLMSGGMNLAPLLL